MSLDITAGLTFLPFIPGRAPNTEASRGCQSGYSGRPTHSGSILVGDFSRMDALNSAGLGARRNEDIALDLLKFVAGTAGVGKPAAPSTGFTGTTATKPDE